MEGEILSAIFLKNKKETERAGYIVKGACKASQDRWPSPSTLDDIEASV
jgi:hypothetical protein